METKTIAAQGDLLALTVDEWPGGLVRRTGEAPEVVAHSETGHHHVARAAGLEVWDDPADPFTCYLRAEGPITIEHLRPWHTHESVPMQSPVRIFRQLEATEDDGWRGVED